MAVGTSNESRSIRLATVYAGSAPGVNTNILATGIVPPKDVGAFRITVALAAASVFNVRVTDGTTAYTQGLKESAALNAGDLYTFTMGVSRTSDGSEDGTTLTYNFQVETDGVIQTLIVDGVVGGVV